MKSTLILLLITITFSVAGQHSYIPSERTFTTKDGLSSDKIHALHKDSKGFIWIGTENGLDRFDGQSFVHFNKNTHPEMSLNRVQMIAEDDEGYLWLVEKNKPFEHYYVRPQINFYHIQTGEWTTLEERFGDKIKFDKEQVSFVKQLKDGSIFLFINLIEKSYLYQKGGLKEIKMPKDISRVSDVMFSENGELIFEGIKGVKELKRQIFKVTPNGKISQQVHPNASWRIQSQEQSYHLKLSSANPLIGAKNLDVYQLIAPNLEFTSATNGVLIDYAKMNKAQNLLWLKSETSLFVTKTNGEIVYQKDIQQDYYEMPILFDGHTTWYSDKQNGLVALTLSPNHFQTYQSFKAGFSNSARGIYADNKDNIWISTISGVLHKSSNQKDFKFNNTNIFTSFLKDNENNLWSIREGKLSKIDLTTGKEELIPHEYLNFFNSWSMYQAKDGNLWFFGNFGTHLIFNTKTNEFREASKIPVKSGAFYVYDIQQRDKETVWLCTNLGLYLLDSQGKYIAHYNKTQTGKYYLPTTDIHHLHQDENGTTWLATGDAGLLELKNLPDGSQANNEKLIIENQYTTKNGLSCDILHSVYEDDYEYLWLSSNEGLMQFDKQTGKVVTYNTENGLLHNEFNRISHFQAEDGTLYFGGLTGVISFHPKHFSKVRHEGSQAPLVVTNFQQFSAKKGQFEYLTQQLTQSKIIRLQPHDRFFKLNIALLDFKSKATYQYRIRDLYDWQTTQDSELNISGLPYGKYTLEIKAFNTNQNEAANTLSYSILVLRPFYLQWWFLILVLGSLGTGVFYFFKWRTQQLLVFQETEQLRELDKMKSQFFANISHELRTPITLILAPLSQLLKQKDLQEKYKSQIGLVHQNGKNLLSLVNEVLDLSKMEVGKLELHPIATKIPQFFERIVANFESAAKVKGIEYQFMTFLQKDIVALFDQEKLEKILNNLLSNALKFTPKNGTIQIIVGQMEKDLIVKVKDSGDGISDEDLPFIFDRYFQSKNKQMSGGTGIGLALTKELVELMGGQISVQSEVGEGTEFEIKLPIVAVVDTLHCNVSTATIEKHQTQEMFNPILTKVTSNKNKDTILLVEDNPLLQQFIQSVLAPHYNVVVTGNGVEALEELLINNYQLIISDVMMPEMDGFTLLEKVKADDRFCSIPFVLLTARADIQDKLRGLRIGVDDYMTKPFEVEELLLRIKNLIKNSKNRLALNIEEEKVDNKPQKVKSITKSTNHQLPITNHDLKWLEQVETIALRELKNNNFNTNQLADELFISKSKLFRKIKSITGLTPMKYIKLLRLQKAKRILETEEVLTLTEVCYAIGLENTTHFAKAYEAEFGKRPHELLKNAAC